MANYPKSGHAVAKYTGERPCTRDPYSERRDRRKGGPRYIGGTRKVHARYMTLL